MKSITIIIYILFVASCQQKSQEANDNYYDTINPNNYRDGENRHLRKDAKFGHKSMTPEI